MLCFLISLPFHYDTLLSLIVAESWGEQKPEKYGKELSRLFLSLLFSFFLLQLPKITDAEKAMPVSHLRAPCVNSSHNLFHLSSFLCVNSALLEQLNQLQALLPNSSSKTTNRGTCILVRHNTSASICTTEKLFRHGRDKVRCSKNV